VALTPENWSLCRSYLYGIDLFNAGYYWEAHEAWESLWHTAGRTGPIADFLKGLIHLTAAGVKVRQGVPAGVRSHAQRAHTRLQRTASAHGTRFLGLQLAELLCLAEKWSVPATDDGVRHCQGVRPIAGLQLTLVLAQAAVPVSSGSARHGRPGGIVLAF
jgi:predicted metal-dependent hydrolase